MEIKKLSRTALLLALMIVFQSLRLYLPLPPFVAVFIIGSLVNACLLLAAVTGGWKAAGTLAVVAPVVAYLQQALPLPVLLLPVAVANLAYVSGYLALAGRNSMLAISAATTAKFIVIYIAVVIVIQYAGLWGDITGPLTMLLGWPQWITGFGGGVIFLAVRKRLSHPALVVRQL